MSPLPADASVAEALIKVTLVLGVAALTAHGLRRVSAAMRHLVWTLGLAAALVLPLLSAALPGWRVPILPAPASPLPAASLVPEGSPLGRPPLTGGAPVASVAFDRAPAPAKAASPSAPAVDPARLGRALWLLGAGLVALPLLLGALRTQWMLGRSARLDSPEWRALAAEVSADLQLARPVRLIQGAPDAMPMTFGVLRPTVLLPAGADEWPEAHKRAVLTHELAHVKRHDCLTQVVAHAACAAYWFHPLVWAAARRLRVERERASDDLVLESGADRADYAAHLLDLARTLRAMRQPSWAAVAMAGPSQLEGRLLSILDASRERRGPSALATAMAFALAGALAVSLAGLRPWAGAAQAADPSPERERERERERVRVRTAPSAPTPVAPPRVARLAAVPHPQPQPGPVPVPGNPTPVVDPDPDGDDEAAEPSQVAPAVVAALTEALKDEDGDVRRAALDTLAEMRAPVAAQALQDALADAEPEVRARAAFALGQMRVTAAVAPLSQILGRDASADVRAKVAFALGEIRSRDAVPALSAALKDADGDVRKQAVFALGQLRAGAAVDGLVAALRDSDAEVRKQAAFALGEIRDPRALPGLAAAVADAEAEVREQAVFALGELHAPEAVDPLVKALKDADADVRKQAVFALGQIRNREAVPSLIPLLADASAEIRKQAAFALGELRDERAAEALVKALKDADASVRRQAAFALGELSE
jgi:HEAT repeat protein/beta-lactamase regulating signal transducer with metallopeptidase domain